MGRDKAGVLFDGEPLLVRAARRFSEVFPEVLVVGGDGRDGRGRVAPGSHTEAARRGLDALPGVRLLADDVPGLGPLGGIATALDAAIAPRLGGRAQPLAALYNKSALGRVREAARCGRLCMWRVLEEIGASYVELDPVSAESRALADLDTEDDVARAERLLARRKGN